MTQYHHFHRSDWIVFLLAASISVQFLAAQEKDDKLRSAVESAFAAPPTKLAPGVFVFPVTDQDGQVRRDGYALSQMITFSMVYGPKRRMKLSVPLIQSILADTQALEPDQHLSADTIRRCAAASGADYYAIPTVTARNSGFHFSVEVHSKDSSVTSKRFEHELTTEQFGVVPGLCARHILEHLEVELPTEALDLLAKPQTKTEADAELLNRWLINPSEVSSQESDLEAFLTRNPDCIVAWELYLNSARDPINAITQLQNHQPPIRCERFTITIARRMRDLGRTREAVVRLLEVAATHRGDTFFHVTLTKSALALKDPELIKQVFRIWREAGQTYADEYFQGDLLVDWAWDIRGNSIAADVAPEAWKVYEQRLGAARKVLEHAVELNPAGWVAHTRLITVAMGLGLGREYEEEHFQAAIRALPGYAPAYNAKLYALRPRWGGSAAELTAFGRECLETGLWKKGVPQLFIEAVRDSFSETYTGTFSPEPFREKELWDTIRKYFAEVQTHGSATEIRRATNYYALWGALGGHFQDVTDVFPKLAYDVERKTVDEQVFPDAVNLLYLYDHVKANTKQSQHWHEATVRLALAQAKFDDATKLLDELKPNGMHESSARQHYRRALKLGQQLYGEERLDFTGLHIKHAFDSATREMSPRVEGDLVEGKFHWSRLSAYQPYEERFVFPVGFKRGVITGQFKWDENVNYVSISWRERTNQAPLHLRFYPKTSLVMLVENKWSRNEAKLSTSQPKLRITIGEHLDQIELDGSPLFELRAAEPELGTFSIQVMTEPNTTGSFKIEQLGLELVK